MSSTQHTEFVRFPNDLQEMNRMAQVQPAKMVSRADQRFHNSIHEIAKKALRQNCRVILLAGPSSSGKTTTAHFLSAALNQLGHETKMISLDDFYRAQEETPLREDGSHDFECLEALRVDCIQRCLKDLTESNSCEVPQFDFVQHRPAAESRRLALSPNGIAIIEGIHALNPALTAQLRRGGVVRIYISVKQDISNGSEQLLSAHEVRMIRRLVRDYNFRSTSPEQTLQMWDSVMEGERRYILPFKHRADFTVNSLHAYELGVLRNPALLLLRGVTEQSGWVAEEVNRLLFALLLVHPVDPALLPPTSLIREFIGGGLYS
ncbi:MULTISPECIES: uridine kinase family protein [Caproicibacterium]|uniref:Nucleoside kinase n=1 Tax=Caproicibacterium argilliputei TaxID=3030016 RepID=A0AA97D842_9FIRM|nr:nucleoside kinase [Caproicibacterium argilliputei]WOC31407.1 nucleoside kinase [Caproicibacterium argilliputei]